MDATLQSLLQLYVFSTGRRIFALREVKKIAASAGQNTVVARCEEAIAHDINTRDIESRWSSDKNASQYSPVTRQIDTLVDIALGALRDAIDAEARDSAAGDPIGEAAERLQEELFPGGLAAVTTLPFVDELAAVERILGVLKSPQWADVVVAIGLGRRVARIVELEKEYRAAISAETKTVSFQQVKDARAKGQGLLLSVVAAVLGLHPTDSADDLAGRQKLLAPVLRQNEAIRLALRQKHTIDDVNPETGEIEATTPATPPPAPPTGG